MRLLLFLVVSVAACTAPNPQDEWIAFSSGRTGQGDIYVVGPESGAPQLLVGTEASEGTPRYDPGGRRLVHSRFDSLSVMLVSGDSELFPDPNGDVAPVWSPSGEIAFVVESGDDTDLFLARADGSDRQRLTSDAFIERYPAWHPDGDRLVYAKLLESGWDLHLLEIETGRESRITRDGVYVGHPAWSSDGARIAFDRMYDGQTEIVVLDVASGVLSRLTDNDENDLVPSWSSDGSRIAFAGARRDNWDVWTVTTGQPIEIQRITTDPAFDGGPVFIPASLIN